MAYHSLRSCDLKGGVGVRVPAPWEHSITNDWDCIAIGVAPQALLRGSEC